MQASRRPIVDRVPHAVGSTLILSSRFESELGKGMVRETQGQGLLDEAIQERLRRLKGPGAAYVSISADGPIPAADREVVATRLRAREFGSVLLPGGEPLPSLEPFDLVRVDLTSASDQEALATIAATTGTGCRALAAGISDPAQRTRALELGFNLLEGPFPRLEPMGAQAEMSSMSTTILRLLSLLATDDCPDGVLVDALRADPGVSYKLLRLVNSNGEEGLRESLEFAVRVMGRTSLKRWLSILLVRVQDAASPLRDELIFSSLVRARCGELVRAGPRTGILRPLPDASGAFLLGLFSRLDELLGRPAAEVLGGLKLHPDAIEALVSGTGPAAGLLELMRLAEVGAWDRVEPILRADDTDPEWFGDCWIEATFWAHEQTTGG